MRLSSRIMRSRTICCHCSISMRRKAMDNEVAKIFRKILRDIKVDLTDQFDKNFENESFFGEGWERRKSPVRGDGHILVSSGALRRSISSRSDDTSITFYSSLPYAAIHNDGGEIRVTQRMKSFFWHKYYEAVGGFGRKKDGNLRNDKKNKRLSTEAEFYKAMALMKVGSTVKIPRRRFLGTSPQLEEGVKKIIEDNLTQYFETAITSKLKKQ